MCCVILLKNKSKGVPVHVAKSVSQQLTDCAVPFFSMISLGTALISLQLKTYGHT